MPGVQKRILLLCLCASLLTTVPLVAQFPRGLLRTDTLPRGFFSTSDSVFNATGELAVNSFGVARAPNGHYFVSSKRRVSGGSHEFLEFDSAGRFLAAHAQPAAVQSDFLGLRDLAWDGRSDSGSRIWSGLHGINVYGFDWARGVFDLADVRVLHGFLGLAIQNLAIAQIDGEPTFVAASAPALGAGPGFAGNRVNYHRISDGLPLRSSTPDVGSGAGKWGAAYDAARDVIWWHIDDAAGNANPNGSRTVFKEMDLISGKLTGQIFQGYRSLGGEAFGCEFYEDQRGEGVMLSLVSSANNLQPFGDAVVEMYARGQFGDPCGGQIYISGEAFVGNLNWSLTLDAVGPGSAAEGLLLQGLQGSVPGLIIPGITTCPLLLQISALQVLGAAPIRRGSARRFRAIPDVAELTGVFIAYQWAVLGDPLPLPAMLSDAVFVRIGTNL